MQAYTHTYAHTCGVYLTLRHSIFHFPFSIFHSVNNLRQHKTSLCAPHFTAHKLISSNWIYVCPGKAKHLLPYWLTDWLPYWLAGWLTDWVPAWLSDGRTELQVLPLTWPYFWHLAAIWNRDSCCRIFRHFIINCIAPSDTLTSAFHSTSTVLQRRAFNTHICAYI